MNTEDLENPFVNSVENAYIESEGKFLLFNKRINALRNENGRTDNDLIWAIFSILKSAEKEAIKIRASSNTTIQTQAQKLKELNEQVTLLEKDLRKKQNEVHQLKHVLSQSTTPLATTSKQSSKKQKPENWNYREASAAVFGRAAEAS
jgi:chromosome segregation ATPase